MKSTFEVDKKHCLLKKDFVRKELGCFSKNTMGDFLSDKSSLSYLHTQLPFTNLDLKIGLDTYIDKKTLYPDNLESILKWHTSKGTSSTLKDDFVIWRGLLKKLMVSPYEKNEDWAFIVRKYKGTHFVVQLLTKKKFLENSNQTTFQQHASYWGFKFEQYMTTDKRGGTPNTDVPVNNYKCLGIVYRNQLSQHSILVGGEVDCLSDNGDWVELKTSKINCANYTLKRFKMLNWWAQSYLLGVEKVVVGLRDDDGVVKKLHQYPVNQLPLQAIEWRPDVCLGFLNALLQFVKDVVRTHEEKTDADDDKIYLFERRANSGVSWRLIEEREWKEGEVEGSREGERSRDSEGSKEGEDKEKSGDNEKGGDKEKVEGSEGWKNESIVWKNRHLVASVVPSWYTDMLNVQEDLDEVPKKKSKMDNV